MKKHKEQTQDIVGKDLEDLQGKVLDLENQLKRAVADYHNLEKRVEEGRSQLNDWATTELILKLLPSLDHLETVVELGRGTLSEEESTKQWYKGVELAVGQLKNTLKESGLEEIGADGQFDPNLHEAVDTGEGEENKIIKVAAKGYSLQGKVIRPAKVVVGRKEN